jgi:hypothetical protein
MGALALATEDPNPELLNEMPHGRNQALITSKMWKHILVQGLYQVRVAQWGGDEMLQLSCSTDFQCQLKSVIFIGEIPFPDVSTAVLDDVQPLCLAGALHLL